MTNEQIVAEVQAGRDVQRNMAVLYEQNRRFIAKVVLPYTGKADFDDLMQEGYLGLYEAVKRFDPAAGIQFLSYAGFWIKQRIQRYAETNGHTRRLPVHLQERIHRINRYMTEYSAQHGAEPSQYQICAALALSPEQVEVARMAADAAHDRSIDSAASEDSDTLLHETVPDPYNAVDDFAEDYAREQAAAVLWGQVDSLPGELPEIIRGRFLDGLTLAEVSERCGLPIGKTRSMTQRAITMLRRRRHKLEEVMIAYDYFPGMYGGSLRSFNRTWTSSTERLALKLAEPDAED